ncbi:alpha/beta hydrolase [Phanerochaete sordida]|uniref:Alpha/beta hydrolase n=1 Tax=Phanerochaete sordida TaxID=48140 RepID=A0A9P3GHA9_9APHY|nr:alpha/beta hydrolase [Phanerochaete sordida]
MSTTGRLLSVTCVLLVAKLAFGGTLHYRDASFDWSSLPSSTNLTWLSCFSTFECARLTVPLQYSNPGAGEAQIALIKSPSSFARTDSRFAGSLLVNPGGPGTSAVDFVRANVAEVRPFLGPQYDIIGFDPRVVGHTTPPLSLFASAPEALVFYAPYPQNVGPDGARLGRMHAQAQILGELAAARAARVAASVSTPAGARDMFAIMTALGERTLNYYGISYGTVLGATFAAMYPDYVGRFVLDGVVDAPGWYSGDLSPSLSDTATALSAVLAACTAAGPACALGAPTPAGVRARLDAALDRLSAAPLPVFDASTGMFAVVGYETLYARLLGALQSPYEAAAPFFAAVAALERGDGAPLLGAGGTNVASFATCDFGVPYVAGFLDVRAPILCGDALGDTVKSLGETREAFRRYVHVSEFAQAWCPLEDGLCTGWMIRAADPFNGSLTASTSAPVLVTSNLRDPLAPISKYHLPPPLLSLLTTTSARALAAALPGAVLLAQNATGKAMNSRTDDAQHTALAGFAACTGAAIRAYLASGALPTRGTVCQSGAVIFGDASAGGGAGAV